MITKTAATRKHSEETRKLMRIKASLGWLKRRKFAVEENYGNH